MSVSSVWLLGAWLCVAPPGEAAPPEPVAAPASEPAAAPAQAEARAPKQGRRSKKGKRKKKRKAADDPYRLEKGVLPAVAYDIDLGFGFGALVTLAKFHPDFQPYRWRLEILAYATVKNTPGVGYGLPFHDDYIKSDFPGLFNNRLRINATARFRRFTNQGWYGVGNASELQKPWDAIDPDADPEGFREARRYQQYDRIYPSLDFNTRLILWDRSNLDGPRPCASKRRERCPPHAYRGVAGGVGHKRRLEALIGTSLAYNIINPYPNSKLEQDIAIRDGATPDGQTLRSLMYGTDDHFLWTLNLGLLYDTRDHEYVPTRGSFTELSTKFSPGVDEQLLYARLHLGTSNFIPLYDEYLVLATHAAIDLLFGRPPIYELGQMGVLSQIDGPGGSWSIRGVPRQRYFGKQKALINVELRSIFYRFNIANQRFGLGALAFVDVGRLWTDYKPVLLAGQDVDGRFSDIKVGVGGGLRITWGETLVIRVDPAYSPTDQNFGFYLDIGQLF
jgi:hypothetical protein